MTAPRVLLLDHADSFACLLADQFARLGAAVEVVRATLSLTSLQRRIAATSPQLVVLSPGPGHPQEATTTMSWLAQRPQLPTLGVCLGHQAMGLAAGARVVRGKAPMHGVAADVELLPSPLFAGLPRRIPVARYHSLCVTDLPSQLEPLAHAGGTVMAMRHRELPWIGLQFHPESVLTPHGAPLLRAVLQWAAGDRSPDREEYLS